MSTVFEEKALQPLMATMLDYVTEFSHQMQSWRYLEGGYGDWSDIIAAAIGHDPYVELLSVYNSWINWPYPTPWKAPRGLHFFRVPVSAQQDWPPPQWWLFGPNRGILAAALPQDSKRITETGKFRRRLKQ